MSVEVALRFFDVLPMNSCPFGGSFSELVLLQCNIHTSLMMHYYHQYLQAIRIGVQALIFVEFSFFRKIRS